MKRLKKFFKRMSPPLMVTEDTPPDMLAGAMDLRLVLPNGSRVKTSVDRRTPMMDLLVQVTTAYKISPAGHVLQPYGESGLLPYKPSTPIGALDTWTVHIVPKHQALQNPANKISLKQVVQPFEQTFRFQVNLPRNQLFVTRVNGRTTMCEILEQACREKGLDVTKYTLKHPKQLDGVSLCEELSVAEYGHNQVTMVSSRALPSSVSSEDILAMHKYTNSSKSCESSSRSLSPDSSVSPRQPIQPSRPLRKRRPAPKPPTVPTSQPPQSTPPASHQKQSSPSTNGPVICHSRTSSDSSGYHEASVLSESPDSNNSSSLPDSLPRRSKLPSSHEPPNCTAAPKQKLSRSLSNLHQASTSTASMNGSLAHKSAMKPAQSTSSLVASRKKKPAPPPPVFSIAEEREETSSTTSRTSKTLPSGTRLQECYQIPDVIPQAPPSPPVVELPVEPPQTKPIPPTPSRIPDCVDNLAPRERKLPIPQPRRIVVLDRLEDMMRRMAQECDASLKSQGEGGEAIDSSDTSSIVTPSETERIEAEIERMFEQATREHVSLESGVDVGESPERLPSPPTVQLVKTEVQFNEPEDPFMDWEYKLPAPPTFRDDTNSPPLTEYSTMTVGKMKEVLYESTNNNRNVKANSGSTELIDELSSAVVDRKVLKSQSSTQCCKEDANPSNLDNFQITTYGDQSKRLVRLHSEEAPSSDTDGVSSIAHNKVETSKEIKLLVEEEKADLQEDKKAEVHPSLTDREQIKEFKPKASKTVFINDNLATCRKQLPVEPARSRPTSVDKPLMNGVVQNGESKHSERKTKGTSGVLEENCSDERLVSPVIRTSSFVQEKKECAPVKRSISYVSCLAKARMNLSKSNSDLLESSEEENPAVQPDQQIRLHLRPVVKSNLRKSSSEISINMGDPAESNKILDKQEASLQSLQVLRAILPQISQSQDSINTVGINTREITVSEEPANTFVRPTISVSTWGERPKRQVSIKSDRDYVFGQKVVLKPVSQVAKTSVPLPPQPKPPLSMDKRNKPSVYKTLETGNTKPIKLQQEATTSVIVNNGNANNTCGDQHTVGAGQLKLGDVSSTSSAAMTCNSRLPVVRSVELKKPYQLRQQEPIQPSPLIQQQQRPVSCYLFGCEPTIPPAAEPPVFTNSTEKKFTSIVGINHTPTPPPPPPSIVMLKPVSSTKRGQLPPPPLDPREELLRSIRSFGGRDSLRKVSTR
ncbi:uncharacterized protein isoform X3 [Rhodnius prolixus]|uniref:uncharacterized protein isoform X3 n=1 Tax=Rhodnius prolixus TaxID=13249 RepID=UPI003D1882CA